MARTTKRPTEHQHAIAYVRVSTVEQVREGVSLAAQRSKIAAWCELMGYELAQTFADEGVSGYHIEKRLGLQRAVEAVCASGGVLVVYSLSRLARNTRETLELGERLSKAGADLVSLSEKIDTTSAAGKMVFRMLAVLAEFERDQISERTTLAMDYKRSRQERVSRHIPYGRQLAEDGWHLEENTTEQTIIDQACVLHAEGLSSRKTAAELAKRGLLSRAGTAFTSTAILAMWERQGAGVLQ